MSNSCGAVVPRPVKLPPITFLTWSWVNPNFQLFFIKLKIIINWDWKLLQSFQVENVSWRWLNSHWQSNQPLLFSQSPGSPGRPQKRSPAAISQLWTVERRRIWWKLSEQFTIYILRNISPTSQGPLDMTSCYWELFTGLTNWLVSRSPGLLSRNKMFKFRTT